MDIVQTSGHIPVLLEPILEHIGPKIDVPLRFLDCTFGGGGHTEALLKTYPQCVVVAIDQDLDAKERAKPLLEAYPKRFSFINTTFSQLEKAVQGPFDAILMDLGLSSFQLDDPERGFSFRFEDSTLDMRMNTAQGQPAWEFLEKASEEELIKAIRDYGQERSWRRVVQGIKEWRGTGVLKNPKKFAEQLAGLIGRPAFGRYQKKIHPATQTFQGIRMFINDEMGELERGLEQAFSLLAPKGRLLVVTFHSGEDRYVKRFLREHSGLPTHAADSRVLQERISLGNLVNKKPIVPNDSEIRQNPRSRSAKLRIFEKNPDVCATKQSRKK